MKNNALAANPAGSAGAAQENISAEAVLSRIKRLMAQAQLQEVLGVSRVTMVEWEKAGKLPPSIKLGRSYFYDPADVHEWLEAQRSR
jgi:predicted DNA-binding transcriptional regulator AlpA